MPWDANRLHKNTRAHSVRSCEQECRRYNTQHIRMIQNYNFTTHAGFIWGCILSLFLLVLALTINFHQSVCLKLQFLSKKKEETQLDGGIEKVPRRHSLVSVSGFENDCKCVGEIYHDSSYLSPCIQEIYKHQSKTSCNGTQIQNILQLRHFNKRLCTI